MTQNAAAIYNALAPEDHDLLPFPPPGDCGGKEGDEMFAECIYYGAQGETRAGPEVNEKGVLFAIKLGRKLAEPQWLPIEGAPYHDGAKIIGLDPKWGVCEMMRDGTKQWVVAAFNGQVIFGNPTLYQPLPAPPVSA